MKIITKISEWYWDNIGYKIREVAIGIKNIFRWIPVIYKDRDWDQSYIFNILKFKLTKHADCLEKRKFYVGVEYDVSRMRLCINLIDKINEEYYSQKLYYKHCEKWGKTIFNFTPSEKEGLNNLDITHEKVITPEDKEQERKESSEMYQKGQEMEAKAQRLLFELLDMHIQRWWD